VTKGFFNPQLLKIVHFPAEKFGGLLPQISAAIAPVACLGTEFSSGDD